ncbi:hypothetical protein ONE63_002470 [Megalurothrips usitatus]|uniref:Ketosynthase family 3 (KS3) domain-containing protein n=1 Tax=Megalurothrips usitatus TaxID=439358 RepID=A0AAV7X890_9NEOP|nr:hypothetical protein ONE63_002470 [Megalurothrips usitatus]
MRDVDVVISGIGANFPQSFNVQDFGRDLLDNKHLPTPTKRWKIDIQPVVGEVPFGDFDAVFYGMSKRLAKNTDPVSKMGLQRSVEAIIDAGLHPQELKGANVNVYVGCGTNEFEQRAVQSRSALTSEGYTIMGMSRTMFANRISYYFDFKGSSCATDSSWPVVHLHLQSAANAIRQGECDAALVAASHLARLPETSTALRMLGLVNGEGITRSFDENASGSVRSDAVVAFLVQRGDHAKRCYAKVLAAGLDFTGPGSVLDPTMPNPRGMEAFLTNLYRTHDIDPRRIAYLEADGSAHPIRDECELDAFDSALIKGYGRSQPLPVGSVKSNLGHTDAVCGYASICKAIVAMETGTVPATINFSKPNPKIKALAEGRMQVVDANMPLQLATDSVVAVNTLGLSSAVGHTVLQPNPRAPQAPQDPSQHLPRIITLAGRTEDGAREVAKKVLAAPFDTNYYRLVQDAFSANIRGYDYRTYVICPSSGTENIPVTRVEKRPVWFVYSGMGSQWPGMGAELMRIPIFAATIERLHAVLEPKGLHLKNIITDTDPNVFDNILKSFVGISACQIALTNLLTAMNVVPDGIIGHSVGELGCAYADGCLTEEQTILAAWARGVASNEAELVKGMMAAIGWGYKDVLSRLPPSIDVACRNSSTSCTLSGPAEDVTLFVKELSDEGVFAKAVNVSDIAYHSRYIQPAAPFLRERLEQVIPDPKPRSEKWVSTSVPEDQQDSDGAKFCSAHYHTNNLLSPVLFEDGLKKVPAHALAIEIAPHGLLQAILKRALPDAQHVPLTHRGGKDPVHFFFEAIGKMSFGFAAPNVAALYPEVSFPVPRGTQSLAPLVTWQHDEEMDMFKDIQDWVRLGWHCKQCVKDPLKQTFAVVKFASSV